MPLLVPIGAHPRGHMNNSLSLSLSQREKEGEGEREAETERETETWRERGLISTFELLCAEDIYGTSLIKINASI